jgi:hypothetical protein
MNTHALTRNGGLFAVSAVTVMSLAGCVTTAPPIGGGTDPGSAPTSAAPTSTTAPQRTAPALLRDPEGYATATFEAWIAGDNATLSVLAGDAVSTLLASRAPRGTDGWQGPEGQGAAGSMYCTWSGSESRLILRVVNQWVDEGTGRAVVDAFFDPADGWLTLEFASQADADAVQAAVDEGHQPWRLVPAEVARNHVLTELGWYDVDVTPTPSATVHRVTNLATGEAVAVTLIPPTGGTHAGIWSVIRVSSVA